MAAMVVVVVVVVITWVSGVVVNELIKEQDYTPLPTAIAISTITTTSATTTAITFTTRTAVNSNDDNDDDDDDDGLDNNYDDDDMNALGERGFKCEVTMLIMVIRIIKIIIIYFNAVECITSTFLFVNASHLPITIHVHQYWL